MQQKNNKSQLLSDAVEKKESKNIWDEEEVAEGAEYDDIYDTRQQPE